MINPYCLLDLTLARSAANGHGGSTVDVLIVAVLVILGLTVLLFAGLVLLRMAGSSRERRILEKKAHLSPLVYDLLTEDRSAGDVVATLGSVVPARDRRVLEQVLLENSRFLKGREREVLAEAFDRLGYLDEDLATLGGHGMVRKAEAAFHLGTMRCERAAPALAAALSSSANPEVQFSCLNALSKIGTPEALRTVMDYLASSPEMETLRVAEVILERKQEFTGFLEQWLERGEADPSRLTFLVNMAGAVKDAHTVPLITRLLRHEDAGVRARAAFSLGTIGDYTACDDLAGAMGDGDAGVRAEAAEALGKLQCEAAISALERGLIDEDVSVRINSAISLSQLGEEGRTVLESALLSVEEAVREVAAEALEAYGPGERDKREGS
ncbi:MAG: HEAT repeat domain-containing protein [Actinobacteria bacterium]|nr:HEAT repeat domain-containing protein [Actinomycetota bacterium]MBU1943770.1 HEAT repeat domain-containing protein [Actinomycetota bacterium]MBU2688794.1 HEAT repeat domain-containing protein [Actinomycetota bacterium]